MGKITLTPLQKSLFEQITNDPSFPKTFYFTGGTALSAFYFHHRESEDLDFFSEKPFDTEIIADIMNKVSLAMGVPLRITRYEKVKIFEFVKNEKLLIKVDFVHHPYKRLEKGMQFGNTEIDSLIDIATNKLLTVNQRTEVKDFVDLYFLLEKFTIWDLFYGLKVKYNMEFDMVLLAADFLKAKDFDFLPKMVNPLSLDTLKAFFREKAKELGKRSVE